MGRVRGRKNKEKITWEVGDPEHCLEFFSPLFEKSSCGSLWSEHGALFAGAMMVNVRPQVPNDLLEEIAPASRIVRVLQNQSVLQFSSWIGVREIPDVY